MSTDYRKFKTPYYTIAIGDSTGQKMKELPAQLARLVEKVEIFETYETGDPQSGGQFSTITLSFIEGSREPFLKNVVAGSKGLYSSDKTFATYLNNRTGLITDLKFDVTKSVEFVPSTEVKTTKALASIETSISGNDTTTNYKNANKAPLFLFQERNQIKVTWGYREDPKTVRSMRGYITVVRTEFPESGPVRTTVTCNSARSVLDIIAAKHGKAFGKRVTVGQGYVFEDLDTSVMLNEICDAAGITNRIISTNLPVPKLDRDHQKVWIAGESFDQFVSRLAKTHNCYYEVVVDPATGVDTLVFVKKQDLESKLVITDRSLLDYKNQGSILKSVNINADFRKIIEQTQAGILNNNNKTDTKTKTNIHLFHPLPDSDKKYGQHIDTNPTENNPVLSATGITNGVLGGKDLKTGKLEVSPDQSVQNRDDAAAVKAEQDARAIQLDFTTLGYTRLTPGTVEIRGIGSRYSGRYKVLTVIHSLDASGYVSKATATTVALATGGVSIPDAPKAKPVDNKVQIQLIAPSQQPAPQAANVRDVLNALLFKV